MYTCQKNQLKQVPGLYGCNKGDYQGLLLPFLKQSCDLTILEQIRILIILNEKEKMLVTALLYSFLPQCFESFRFPSYHIRLLQMFSIWTCLKLRRLEQNEPTKDGYLRIETKINKYSNKEDIEVGI